MLVQNEVVTRILDLLLPQLPKQEAFRVVGFVAPAGLLSVPVINAMAKLKGEGLEGVVLGAQRSDIQARDVQFIKGPVVAKDQAPSLHDVLSLASREGGHSALIEGYNAFLETLPESTKGTATGPMEALKAKWLPDQVDLVVIDNDTFESGAIVRQTLGAKAILVGGSRKSVGGSLAFEQLFNNPKYELAYSNDDELGGLSLFIATNLSKRALPIHFFTIVLNGEPFIRYHEKMMLQLRCDWHWHIVEGVADLVKDTAWSVAAGGNIPDSLHHRGKSNDGTTLYLDELKARFPNTITIYRKPDDVFWNGKQEMVAAPIPNIKEHCLLWQIDADELWTPQQVETMRQMFLDEPDRTAAFFWCNYFVGPTKVLSTRYNYAQNPSFEWLRVWQFEPGMIWDKHEPPVLAQLDDQTGERFDVGHKRPFRHHETERKGLVFDHFAYVTADQARFKESYYGYKGAVSQWEALQSHQAKSGLLRDYFAWVSDNTVFDTAERLGIDPLAFINPATASWEFVTQRNPEQELATKALQKGLKIAVDGVFFQLSNSGIARVWVNLLQAWVKSGFADQVVLLDRGGTAPRIEGVIYHTIELHDSEKMAQDSDMLEEVCQKLRVNLFLSTYYTTPTQTNSVFFGHDMIPEVIGQNLEDVWWQQKRRAIQFAAGHIMVSQSSADLMCFFHPYIDPSSVQIAHNSVAPVFKQLLPNDVQDFKVAHGIEQDYILLVGERSGWQGYKNGKVVFAALGKMAAKDRPLLVCVGGQPNLDANEEALLGDVAVKFLQLDDDGLRAAYGGALAFVCPSLMEGFGLPIIEAMSLGCPALVCNNTSIPEVAGDAGLYFDPNNAATLVAQILRLKEKKFRSKIIELGFKNAAKFDQDKTAHAIHAYLSSIAKKMRASGRTKANSALSDLAQNTQKLLATTAQLHAAERNLFQAKLVSDQGPKIDVRDLSEPKGTEPAFASDYMEVLEQRMLGAYRHIRELDHKIRKSQQFERDVLGELEQLRQAEAARVADIVALEATISRQQIQLETKPAAAPMVFLDNSHVPQPPHLPAVKLEDSDLDYLIAPVLARDRSADPLSAVLNKIGFSQARPELVHEGLGNRDGVAPVFKTVPVAKPKRNCTPRAIRPFGIPELPVAKPFVRNPTFKLNFLQRKWLHRTMGPWFDASWYTQRHQLTGAHGQNPLNHFTTLGLLDNLSPSPLFDPDYYLEVNRDVAETGVPAFWHFFTRGLKEKRTSSRFFDQRYYLDKYPDTVAQKTAPIAHFLIKGMNELRAPHPLFDPEYYLEMYQDVAASNANPLRHYLEYGLAEGRTGTPLFDSKFYLRMYPEIALSGLDPMTHFMTVGTKADYQPHPLFDPEYYLERYSDVRDSGMSAFEHFLVFGLKENRQPHPLFDPKYYLSTYPDVAASQSGAYVHFVRFGIKENRRPHPLFDPHYYRSANKDVDASGLHPFEHFITIGLYDGRNPNELFSPNRYEQLFGDSLRPNMPVFEQYLRYGLT
jgi:glycosyltransferase involved in cell wall biosynthesis